MKWAIAVVGVLLFTLGGALLVTRNNEVTGPSDEPLLSEGQVFDILYRQLTEKADNLQGTRAEFEKLVLNMRIQNSSLSKYQHEVNASPVTLEAIDAERWKKASQGWFYKSPEPTTAVEDRLLYGELSKFAGFQIKAITTHDGGEWWNITLGEAGTWRINEQTEEVLPLDDKAIGFLQKTTLRTYHHREYGFEVDYPPSWFVEYSDERGVLISSPDRSAGVVITVTEPNQTSGELRPTLTSLVSNIERFIEVKLGFYRDQFYEFELITRDTNRIVFFSRSGKDAPRWENRSYFLTHNGRMYEIASSTTVGPYAGLGSTLYDGYKSFRFEP